MSLDEKETNKGADNGYRYEYPLDKYLVTKVKEKQRIYDGNNLETIQENVSTYARVTEILKSAEYSLKCMSTCLSAAEPSKKVVRIKEPSYFNENFDRRKYIKELVSAKLRGCEIVQEVTPVKISNIVSHHQFLLDKLNRDARQMSNYKRANSKIIEVSEGRSRDVVDQKGSGLSMQLLPGVNIRSQLSEQVVSLVDIQPSSTSVEGTRSNVVVIESKYGEPLVAERKTARIACEVKEESVKKGSIKKPKRNVEFSERVTSDGPYLFLNNHSGNVTDVPKYPKRNISKLKKFGVPEVADIYNPKTKFVVNKTSHPHFHKRMFEMTRIDPNSRRTGELLLNYKNIPLETPHGSNSASTSSRTLEYIPYTKLTIGGVRAEDVERRFSKKAEKLDEGSSTEEDATERTENADDSQNEQDSVSLDYNEESETSELQVSEANKIDHQIFDTKRKMKSLKLKSKADIFEYVHNVETKSIATQFEDASSRYKNAQTSPLKKKNGEFIEYDKAETSRRPAESTVDIKKITLEDLLNLEKMISSLNMHLNIEGSATRLTSDVHLENVPQSSTQILENVPQSSTQMLEHAPQSSREMLENAPHNSTEILENAPQSPKKMVENDGLINRDTQTSPSETAFLVPPLSESDEIMAPILGPSKIDVQTSPMILSDAKNLSQREESTTGSKSIIKKRKSRKSTSADTTVTTTTDLSRSETSEAYSLGEVNLTILRKRIVRVLNRNGCSPNNSISTSVESTGSFVNDSNNKSVGEI